MKQLTFVSIFAILFGCSNMASDKEAATSDVAETLEETQAFRVDEAFDYATITQQKLQEYIDLQLLKNEHPELAKTIAPQLQKLLKDSIALPKNQDSLVVKNLSPLGTLLTVNDTLRQQKFSFALASNTFFKTDTLIANISTMTRQVHGEDVVVNKVYFSKQ
ncbi:hypothetical protein G5B37_06275 [Rasiella rasia]|uniref:Lipoprotein n=1 Tax=Rasiella rasia TaxID=2744027 RepID=A0A6G6GKV2_9FLAO|nr:hypothetical protein [Rasiella rasia]QIE59178.1 hypothetical protein G5B37_06275 [Rasiella rasia]